MAIAAAVLVVIAAIGVFVFLRSDAPDEVDLETAVESVSSTTSGDGSAAEGPDVSGTWTVDAETGEFDFESATGTFAGFRIDEQLVDIGAAEAVGRTGAVSGTVEIEGNTVTKTDVTIDMTTITTDRSMRNRRVQEALETDQFPTATFSLTTPIELPPDAASGEKVAVTAKGDLTVHGVTQPVAMSLEAQLVDNTIVVVGSTDVTFADFGIEVPSAPAVLSVADTGTLELQMLLTKS